THTPSRVLDAYCARCTYPVHNSLRLLGEKQTPVIFKSGCLFAILNHYHYPGLDESSFLSVPVHILHA
ncbi:MAG: hypothetical protein ACOYN4_19465, partial [Bacteroidales bacterium]